MARTATLIGLPTLCAFALAACYGVPEIDYWSETDRSTDGTDDAGPPSLPPPLDAMDVIFVVDDSQSMAEEHAILATSVFHLVASLTTPPEDWPYPAVDDVRVAVVTTNMGLSADGVPGDEDWPGEVPESCSGLGDDGEFQEAVAQGVMIRSGVIPCWDAPGQCPPGWECSEDASPEGSRCVSPTPDEKTSCSGAEGHDHAETSAEDPSSALALEVACLASQGTSGCGFEQQLAAAARGALREDHAWFVRENAGLAIIVVSDEDDCSMDDNAGLLATTDVTNDPTKWNIACGLHPEFLESPEAFIDVFASAKGGFEESVFFAAIVGVPPVSACQGNGALLDACLEQDEMQLVAVQDDGGSGWYWEPACTRTEGAVEITSAYPGRRFVELAEGMGRNGYVYSICNDNWMPAMESFAAILADAAQKN